MRFTIRPVSALDAEALWEIYAPYTLTPLTYEYPAPDLEEFARRIARVSDIYPYLVCEADGLPVGYAYAHRYRERASYDWDAELSIYLSPSAQGRGIGRALYTALFSLLRVQGFVNVYGCVAAPNPPSEHLHAAHGHGAGVHRPPHRLEAGRMERPRLLQAPPLGARGSTRPHKALPTAAR